MRIEAALANCRVLLPLVVVLRILPHIAVDEIVELVGGYDAVAVLIRPSFHTANHIVSEDTVPAAPVFAFIGNFAVATGRLRATYSYRSAG